MERTHDDIPLDDMRDEPPPQDEAAVYAMLEQSRQDIADGRTVPLAPVLEAMRARAKRIRDLRPGNSEGGRLPA